MSVRVVIIGAGIAGVEAAARLAGKAEIILVSGEGILPYYRMRIDEIISGTDAGKLAIHPLSWYEERGIRILHDVAERIDTGAKCVHLHSGDTLFYDFLILATGSRALSFPVKGTEREIYTLRTVSDAYRLRERLTAADSFAVIGGGLLGLELAAAAAASFGIETTVIETAEHLLPRQLDADSAEIIKGKLKEKGINVLTGTGVESADDKNLFLSDGRVAKASVAAFSVGVRAETALASDAGIKTGKAIIVDDRLMTSVPGIYAAGDAAELDGRCFGLAMHAREMGAFIAAGILGNDSVYKPSEPSSILKVAGIELFSAGSITGEPHVAEDGGKRLACFVEDGIIKGVVLIGDRTGMAKAGRMIGTPYDSTAL